MKKIGKKVLALLISAAMLLPSVPFTASAADTVFGGTIVDTNTQYTQARYAEVKAKNVTSAELNAWANDKAVSELVIYSGNRQLNNVTVTAGALTGSGDSIDAEHVTATFIKSVKAYNGTYLGYGDKNRAVPAATASNRSESSDILYQTEPITIPANSLQPVWVEFDIPSGTKPGVYTGTLSVSADGAASLLKFTYRINVQNAELPDADTFADTFDIELWQYPYSSAEYYNVDPFSERHLELMRSSMLKYKEIGGHAVTASIVEEAWNGQTYSKNDVHYPSMVKWTKNSDGSFHYDYTDFDKWIEFNKSLGLGDKIVLYSIAPWHNSFTYWEGSTLKYESFTPGNARYTAVWKDFLQNLTEHLMAKGWFDESYIGIDERGFNTEAFDLIDSVKNIHGESLKTAGAMDGFVNKKALAMRVTDLNVGDSAAAAHPEDFQKLLEDREKKGLRTTLYSCTEHKPGNFSLSAPVESYWSIVNAGKMGTAGFLRWAYDAWVEEPLKDATHNAFEPGDCFLIYPDEKNAAEPESKSSVRLEKMAEGLRDVNKLMLMEREVPALSGEIEELYAGIATTASAGRTYLTDAEKTRLASEMDAFKAGVAEITEKYVERKAAGTNEIESLAIAEGARIEMTPGAGQQLHAVFTPANVLNTRVKWTSSNDSVVSVDKQGKMTALQIGTVRITAVSEQDSSKKASVVVSVSGVEIDESAQAAYYSFDNMENGVIKDEWGSRNGTSQGAVLAKGKSGNALEISEAEKSARLEGTAAVGDAWTVGYWVYATASGTRSSVLMSSDKNYSFDTRLASDRTQTGVHVGTGSGDVLTFRYDFPANTWMHVAWTQDKTKGLSMYVNGRLVETNAWTTTHDFVCPLDIIGGTGFTGKIDELKIYNRVLTNEEIFSSMQSRGLNVQETVKELEVGADWQILVNLISDEEDKTIRYTSANPEIASVDEDGMVTAKKRGSTVITVENEAGGYTENIEINVVKLLYIKNRLPVYTLDEKYLSDVEKAPGGERQYLGQPDMIMLDDNQTLFTAFPVGHGCGPLVMKVSRDAGESWQEKTDIPDSWADSLETPTMYKLDMQDGSTKLMMITGRPNWHGNTAGGWNTSISTDNGETWSEYKTFHSTLNGQQNWTIVAMASLVHLKDEQGNFIDKWMGVYHNYDYVNYKTYLTFDENGNEQWSEPEPYLSDYRDIERSYMMCEIGMFRSPDGRRIVGLARSQSHNNPATLIYSDDEGVTWSEPMDLPGSLAGERHKALYDPITGRLVITFREIIYDLNDNNQFDGGADWKAGDWIAWVGTYEDLMEQNEGQYRILLDEDWANNAKSGDTGYTGMVVRPDGTFIMDTYGHWDKEFSLSWGGGVTTDLCYIRQAKFSLAEFEAENGIADTTELKDAIARAEEITDAGKYTKESWEAFQNALADARNALKNGTAAQVKAAKEALDAAVKGLKEEVIVTPPDTTGLQEEITQAGQIKDAFLYTAESWQVFQKALREAEEILNNPSSTKEQVDAALAELKRAQSSLKRKQDTAVEVKLNAPVIEKIESPGYTQLNVTWSKVNGAEGYEVYRSLKAGSDYQLAAVAGGDKTVYADGKLKTGTKYYYQVRAFAMVNGQKIYSVSSAAKAGTPVPAKAKLSSVKKLSGGKMKLKWKKVKGASGYEIRRSYKKNGKYKKIALIKKGKKVNFTDAKIKAKKTCYYKVRAYRKVGKKKVYGPYSAVKKKKA